MAETEQKPARPRISEQLELDVESLAYGGRGVARRNGYVVFVAGALPGDRVRAQITKSKRHYAEARTVELLRPSPDRVPDRCDHGGEPCPGAPWQGLPYEEQLRFKQEQVDDALRRLGGLDGFELAPIEPAAERWRYRNKLEYSFGERRRRAGPRLPRPGPLGRDRGRARLPAGIRGQQRPPQRDPRLGSGVGRTRLRPPRRHRRAAKPGHPRGPAIGPAAEPPRHLGGRDPAPPGRPAHDRRGRGGRNRRPHRRARRGVPGGGAVRAPLPDLAPRLLPDQHRNGRAALRLRHRGGRPERRRARLRPLLRHRHPLAGARARRRRGLGRRDRARRDLGRRGERRAERDRERALSRRRRPHHDPAPRRGGRTPRPGRRRSAARRPLEEDRAPPDRVRGDAHRLRLLQPDHPRPQRRPAHGGRL